VTDGQDEAVGTLYVGSSGFSYGTWKGGFYPADAKPSDFLRIYAERLPSVELNTTGYRLPEPAQFEQWAAQTPSGFRFAVKMPPGALRSTAAFEEAVRGLGDRLGPARAIVAAKRDDSLLERLRATELRLALDLRHPSWDGVDVSPAVRVNDWDANAPFRYLRFREPPYSDDDLRTLARRIGPLLGAGIDVFAYFRHEDEPTAPRYAQRLLELVRDPGGA
jgi:uncharacterized protein YecE (DUF72 family)